MLEELKKQVFKANMDLVKLNLVKFTWGNVSGIDRKNGLVVIKPSGVAYDDLTPDKMVVVNLKGEVIEGDLNPSSDTPTHIELYKSFGNIGGITHSHSEFATSFAQAKKRIISYGTTHADIFYGDIPLTRELTPDEILNDYEKNTGSVIAETFQNIDENAVPAVLVASHGPFSWGETPEKSVYNMAVLEETAKMAIHTMTINPQINRIDQNILDKHYFRKHGENAYYGQNKGKNNGQN